MEAQGLIQCLDSFLKKVSDFLNEVLAAEALSAPAMLKKLELIDNLDFIKFYHDPVSFIKSLVQRSGAVTDRAACKCRARGFCVLPATAPRVLRARLDAFSAELRASLAAATVTTAASALLVHRRDLVEPDLEGWLSRRLGDVGGGDCKCYAVLCDAFLALFRSADDADEVAAPAIVVTDKYVLEETTAQNNSYQFTVCGAGDRYTFSCKTQEDMQKWSDCLLRASRLRLQDVLDALKGSTVTTAAAAAATRLGGKGDVVKPQPRDAADRQRQPPEGAAAEPASAGAAPFGSAYPLNDAVAASRTTDSDSKSGELRTTAAAAPTSALGRWSLDLGGFAIPTRRPPPRRDGGGGGGSAERRQSMSSKSSHSLYQSTAALVGSNSGSGGSSPAAPPSSKASSDGTALGQSPALRSVRDHLIKKPPPPGGVRLRAKRSTSAQRRARSLVIENGGNGVAGSGSAASAILDPASSGDAVRRRSVGARISLSASALFTNLAAARSAQRRPTSSERARALLGSAVDAAQIEGCLYHRGLLKWSKLRCKVVGSTLLGFKDAGGGGSGGDGQPGGEQPALQVELRGCAVTETTAGDAKAKKARGGGFKLCPAATLGAGGKPLYFAADSADDLRRWLDVLRSHGGPKTATLREPTADLTSGALQMIELGEHEKAADGGGDSVDVSTAVGAEPKESSVGSGGDDEEWPEMFSDETDLLGGIDLVASDSGPSKSAGVASLPQQQQQQQQGITLPSSPQSARPGAGAVIIETEDVPRTGVEVEYQPDAVVWLSPASSVHSLRSSSTGDDSLANAVLFHSARDDLDLRQMSLQRRQHVLQDMIKEKERLQAALASEKGKYGKQPVLESGAGGSRQRPLSQSSSSSGSERSSAATQLGGYYQLQTTRRFEQQKPTLTGSSAAVTAAVAAATAKQRSSLDDITVLKQHMEGLKDKMRCIDRGLRQSLDPSLLGLHDGGAGLLLEDDGGEADFSYVGDSQTGQWWSTTVAAKSGLGPTVLIADNGLGGLPAAESTTDRLQLSAAKVRDAVPQSSRQARAATVAAGVDTAAKNGPTSATPSALATWSDLRSLIDSLDSVEGSATGARQGQMIVLGDV